MILLATSSISIGHNFLSFDLYFSLVVSLIYFLVVIVLLLTTIHNSFSIILFVLLLGYDIYEHVWYTCLKSMVLWKCRFYLLEIVVGSEFISDYTLLNLACQLQLLCYCYCYWTNRKNNPTIRRLFTYIQQEF